MTAHGSLMFGRTKARFVFALAGALALAGCGAGHDPLRDGLNQPGPYKLEIRVRVDIPRGPEGQMYAVTLQRNVEAPRRLQVTTAGAGSFTLPAPLFSDIRAVEYTFTARLMAIANASVPATDGQVVAEQVLYLQVPPTWEVGRVYRYDIRLE